MRKDFILRRPSGSGKNEPKVMSELLEEFFQSSEPLAVAFRNRQVFPHTEPCIDLKLLTREPGRMHVGANLNGNLTRDGRDHFTFIEDAQERKLVRRYPIVYKGYCINVTRRPDGSLLPHFRLPQYSKYYTFKDFCREAAEELLFVAGFIEEE